MHKIVKFIPTWTLLGLFALTVTTVFGQTEGDRFRGLAWDDTHRGIPLDLTGYHETVRDDFRVLDVTPDGGAGPWFAPVHSSFGAATFLPPGPNGVFSTSSDGLVIRAEKLNGQWQSGLLQTMDRQGHGFAQQRGYFEIIAKFPPGPGAWPAFWLLDRDSLLDRTKPHAEIDVVEWYGGDPQGVHSSVHLWPSDPVTAEVPKHLGHSHYQKVKSSLVQGQLTGFHSYGVMVTADSIIFYLDRHETVRHPMFSACQQPLYMLIDLAVFDKEAAVAKSPKEMVVHGILVYSQ
jgi:hypothetical protein